MTADTQISGNRVTVFCPGATVLEKSEVNNLPEELRNHPHIREKEGVWLSLDCPDRSCLSEAEKVSVPIIVAESGESRKMTGEAGEGAGLWLRMFCPKDQCLIESSSDLP